MKRYITIDGGTTNTRIYLACDGEIKGSRRLSVGSNSPESKKQTAPMIKEAISELLSENGLREEDITRILASGMITSEFGLFTVAHSAVPLGIKDIRRNSVETVLPEISSIPFFFISGIKTVSDSPVNVNFMRGEETELIGILDDTNAIYVLPGSHSKIIRVNAEGEVIGFMSTLTGELISAVANHTILSVSVDIKKDKPSDTGLADGYRYAERYGINEALLKPRAMKLCGSLDNSYIYGFFMGAVLQGEIRGILEMEEKRVIIGGRAEIRDSMAYLISTLSDKSVVSLTDEAVMESTVRGAIRIFEHRDGN